MNNGYLPHVAGAMTMFNKAWSKLLPSTVLKCWSKSQCLSMIQVAQAREIIWQLNAASEESTATCVLNQDIAEEEIYSEICALIFQTQVENPLGEIMPPHTNISNASEIVESLNSFSVSGEEINRHDIAAKDLQKLFDDSRVSVIETDTPKTVDTGTDRFCQYICFRHLPSNYQ